MKKILIATHGSFASGAKSTMEFLLGESAYVTCIDAYVDPDENLSDRLEEYFTQAGSEDLIIVMTDIKGGSVTQKIVPYTEKENVFLIAGFNLPLLMDLALAPDKLTREEIAQCIENSRQHLELVELVKETKGEEDFFA